VNEPRRWIFIRGLGRASEHWEPFMSEFKASFPKDEIELADIRGNGKLNHLKSLTSVSRNVDDLRQRSPFIQSGKKVSLMTISLGSMIGIEWARRFPDEINELVLMNPSDRSLANPLERLRAKNLFRLPEIIRTFNNPDFDSAKVAREKIILQMTTNHLPELDKKAEEWRNFPETEPLNLARQILAASRFKVPDLAPTKTLLMYSLNDQFVSSNCSRRIAKKWGITAAAHPTAGHDLPLEDPQWVTRTTLNWLNNS
jgi:pimeloyl-ACP methyl ester carboxylesterase